MPVSPGFKEKRQLNALINEVDFIRLVYRGNGLLVNDLANPILAKQEEVQPQVDNISLLAPVEANHCYGWEGWTKLVEKRAGEAVPNVRQQLLYWCVNHYMHGV